MGKKNGTISRGGRRPFFPPFLFFGAELTRPATSVQGPVRDKWRLELTKNRNERERGSRLDGFWFSRFLRKMSGAFSLFPLHFIRSFEAGN